MANSLAPGLRIGHTTFRGTPTRLALLGLLHDQILACRLNHLFRHGGQGVNVENPLDLGQKAMQQPEVAAGEPDDRRGGARVNGVTLKCDAGGASSGAPATDESRLSAAEGIRLRSGCGSRTADSEPSVFQAGHPDQDHSGPALSVIRG